MTYQGLISFHMQAAVPDWTRAVASLPAGTLVKSVDDIGILVEAVRVNSGVIPVFRKWVDFSPGQTYDGADMVTKRARAREYFETFIHDPALRGLAGLKIGLWNEVYAVSHTPEETQDRVEQEQAFSDVWQAEYAGGLPGATLVMSCPGVGNDIPLAVAAIAAKHGYWLDYHAYILTVSGAPVAGEWEHYSGRWTLMDRKYVSNGYRVRWMFGEGGPIGRTPAGGADAMAGWRHRDVCNSDSVKYNNVMAYWATRVKQWNQENGRRAYSLTLFTTKQGGGLEHQSWRWFQTVQPEMDMMAALSGRYAESTPPSTIPAPLPTPDPTPLPSPAPASVTLLKVIEPNGLYIRDGAGNILGALPVNTRFGGRLNAGRYQLAGSVSAAAEHVRVISGDEPARPVGRLLPGVDVSAWQRQIDWRLMAEKGVRVAGIRVSVGLQEDDWWRHNHQWARAYGLRVFPYHYFHSVEEPEGQARIFRSLYQAVSWDYPAAGDFETPADADDMADRILRFMQASGAGTVYTSPGWWTHRVGTVPWASNYRLWVAHWDVPAPEPVPGWSQWWGWQYRVTDDAQRYGVQSERLDLDWFREIGTVTGALLSHWPIPSRALSIGGNTWGNPAGHEAVDLGALRGDPVYAAAPGMVKQVGYESGGYGRFVVMAHRGDGAHAGDMETLYAHLTSQPVLVRAGEAVAGGQQLGTVGMTGNTSGPHLHFELRVDGERVDPWPVLMGL